MVAAVGIEPTSGQFQCPANPSQLNSHGSPADALRRATTRGWSRRWESNPQQHAYEACARTTRASAAGTGPCVGETARLARGRSRRRGSNPQQHVYRTCALARRASAACCARRGARRGAAPRFQAYETCVPLVHLPASRGDGGRSRVLLLMRELLRHRAPPRWPPVPGPLHRSWLVPTRGVEPPRPLRARVSETRASAIPPRRQAGPPVLAQGVVGAGSLDLPTLAV